VQPQQSGAAPPLPIKAIRFVRSPTVQEARSIDFSRCEATYHVATLDVGLMKDAVHDCVRRILFQTQARV
jgi:hypothetical protein